MIEVSVKLQSAITGGTTELARLYICNEGGTDKVGDYGVYVLRGRSTDSLDRKTVQKRAKVLGHRRLDEHVWNLVTKALVAAGYKTGEFQEPEEF